MGHLDRSWTDSRCLAPVLERQQYQMACSRSSKVESSIRRVCPIAAARTALWSVVRDVGGAVRIRTGGARHPTVEVPGRLSDHLPGDNGAVFSWGLGSSVALQLRAAPGGVGARTAGFQYPRRAALARTGAARRVLHQDRHRSARCEFAVDAHRLGGSGRHRAGSDRFPGHLRRDFLERATLGAGSSPGGHLGNGGCGMRGLRRHRHRRRGWRQERGCVGCNLTGGRMGHRDDLRPAVGVQIPAFVDRGGGRLDWHVGICGCRRTCRCAGLRRLCRQDTRHFGKR